MLAASLEESGSCHEPSTKVVEPAKLTSVAATTFRNKRFRASYFDTEIAQIRILEDLAEYESTAILIIIEAEVQVLLLLSNTPINIIEKLKRQHDQLELVFRPACDFKYERGLSVLSKFGVDTRINAVTKCTGSLACVAAMHKYLVELGQSEFVQGIDWCNFSSFMSIDMNSLEALGIFSSEDHPNRHSNDKKDGFSVFRLMNRCRSGLGRKMLRSWCLRPLQDLGRINERFDLVQMFMSPDQEHVCKDLHKLLSKVPNLKSILMGIKRNSTSGAFWSLLCFLKALLEIRETLYALPDQPLLGKLKVVDRDMLDALRGQIELIVDFEESRIANRVVVRPRVDARLDELRTFYNGLPDFLSVVARELSGRYSGLEIESLSLVYFPQIGFLITIPLLCPDTTNYTTTDYLMGVEVFELQFATEKFAYLKDAKTRGLSVELDESIGDIHSEIVDLEVEILLQLQLGIGEIEEQLVSYAEACYELDCILSMAEFSREFNLTRPTMVSEPIFDIKQGRHVLAELTTTDAFVPNDCRLEGIVVLTGPNSSGKSVYMKQLGIIVFLAHIGCFVPAGKGSVVGLTDKILTRISGQESLIKNESTFGADLRQVNNIVEEVTPQSLVLIDEFGKGTSNGDGIGLFASLVNWLVSNGRPRTIAITHFHEVYQKELVPHSSISWWSMNVMFKERSDDESREEKDLECFLYKVTEEPSTQSYGLYCAQLAGLPESIINRAFELKAMYEADVPPEDLRYAQLDPETEKEALALIRQLLA